MRTMKELAQEAIDVQNACNLSGVVHSFSRAITELRKLLEEADDFSTSKLNQHPISVLYASKIASLSGCEVEHNFQESYGWAENIIS